MNQPSKDSLRKSSSFWHLGNQLDLPSWKNLLSLPEVEKNHSPSEIKLEQEIGFTYLKGSESPQSLIKVFISEKTNIKHLCKIIPFLFEYYELYLCADHLIQQRLLSLKGSDLFQGENKATKNLYYLLENAAQLNASDIHLESMPEEKQVRIRVDGKLRHFELPEDIEESLFSKIKLNAGMDIAKKRVPQDGHFPFITDLGKRYDLRTSTVPGVNGEKIAIRLLPSASVQFSMKEMGFNHSQVSIIKRNLVSKTGMILFTGPTGSGKTTSLYAILRELISESLNIITIEDPVEYRINSITQVEVNELAGVTFSSALRSFLRQDPDVILIGEIRDHETARIAARAAQTGHLVLSTLHSNNVFEAIHRLKTLGVESDDIASSLKLIVSQRLISNLCHCSNNSNCPDCGGKGIKGRLPLLEIFEISPAIQKMLSLGESIAQIELQSIHEGFVSLRQNGIKMANEQQISLLELDEICPG